MDLFNPVMQTVRVFTRIFQYLYSLYFFLFFSSQNEKLFIDTWIHTQSLLTNEVLFISVSEILVLYRVLKK